jgi:hypothetical protein
MGRMGGMGRNALQPLLPFQPVLPDLYASRSTNDVSMP